MGNSVLTPTQQQFCQFLNQAEKEILQHERLIAVLTLSYGGFARFLKSFNDNKKDTEIPKLLTATH